MRGRKQTRFAILPSGATAVIVRISGDVALVRREIDKEVFRIKTKHLRPLETTNDSNTVSP